MKKNKMDTPPKIPPTMEGIAIHIGYINDHLKSLEQKMDAINTNTVNRDEWNEHLKHDEDHEARIRVLEQRVDDLPLMRKLVYGAVSIILITVLGAIIYLVIKK